MPEIRDPSASAAKWARRAGSAGAEYEEGVRNPRKDWAQAAAEANERYKRAVTEAAQKDRFKAGVNKAGTAKWQANAITKGPGRYSEGVMLAQTSYEDGFRPYADVIRNTKLSPRGPKGSPENLKRVAEMSQALHQKKVSLLGGK